MGAFSILSHYALLRSLRLRYPHAVLGPDGCHKKDMHYKKKNTIFKFHSLEDGGMATSWESVREAGEASAQTEENCFCTGMDARQGRGNKPSAVWQSHMSAGLWPMTLHGAVNVQKGTAIPSGREWAAIFQRRFNRKIKSPFFLCLCLLCQEDMCTIKHQRAESYKHNSQKMAA